MEREAIVYQILDKDNWEVIDQIDSFLYVYDKMPDTMRLVIDLKMVGHTNKEIATIAKISPNAANIQVHRAKRRILNALY